MCYGAWLRGWIQHTWWHDIYLPGNHPWWRPGHHSWWRLGYDCRRCHSEGTYGAGGWKWNYEYERWYRPWSYKRFPSRFWMLLPQCIHDSEAVPSSLGIFVHDPVRDICVHKLDRLALPVKDIKELRYCACTQFVGFDLFIQLPTLLAWVAVWPMIIVIWLPLKHTMRPFAWTPPDSELMTACNQNWRPKVVLILQNIFSKVVEVNAWVSIASKLAATHSWNYVCCSCAVWPALIALKRHPLIFECGCNWGDLCPYVFLYFEKSSFIILGNNYQRQDLRESTPMRSFPWCQWPWRPD